jgi:cytoskeletal protein CcmA (bactofilin family)
MRDILSHPSPRTLPAPRNLVAHRRRGVALLMVLLIVLAITILATGFLAGTSTELACGANTLMRVQLDQVAQSGLEHARGLILHPQDVPDDFWVNGATEQQLEVQSRDYYDVRAARDASRPTDYCTYDITCEAYRLVGTEKTGRSRLAATLRLDPCIGLWSNGNVDFRPTWLLYGDLRSGGKVASLTAASSIDGDAFADSLQGSIVGQVSDVNKLSLAWPPVTLSYANPEYAGGMVGPTLSGSTYPPAIWRSAGNLVLAGNVTIQGMLLVGGNLTIRGNGNRIVAAPRLPALYVNGTLTIEDVDGLQIEGLAVVNQNVQISAAAQNVAVVGALFVGGTLSETTQDASGNGRTGLIRGNPAWTGGRLGGALQLDGGDDYVDCGTSPAFDVAGALTVAAWVNTRDAGDNQHHPYVTKGDHAYALRHRYTAGDPLSTVEFFIYDGTWQSARVPVPAGFNDAWHHLAGTYDGVNVKLYIDGTLAATTPHAGAIALRPELPLYIGANCESPDQFYQGQIDDVRLYLCVLDETAINKIKTGAPIVPSPAARWALDGPGSTLTITVDPMRAAIAAWEGGVPKDWSPAAGAFYRRIRRP